MLPKKFYKKLRQKRKIQIFVGIVLMGAIVLLIVILGGGYFLIQNSKPSPTQPNQTNSYAVSTVPTSLPTVDTSDLQAGGSSYRDTQGVYVFLYPSDFKLDEQDPKRIRIYKTGATQKGQTEMYDGVIVVFETVMLNGQTLNVWVDKNLKTITADGTSEIVEPKQSITHKTYPGFTYSARGLGTAKYYALQKDSKSNYAVVITTIVNDPQNVGFQKEVDKINSTLELLK